MVRILRKTFELKTNLKTLQWNWQ